MSNACFCCLQDAITPPNARTLTFFICPSYPRERRCVCSNVKMRQAGPGLVAAVALLLALLATIAEAQCPGDGRCSQHGTCQGLDEMFERVPKSDCLSRIRLQLRRSAPGS